VARITADPAIRGSFHTDIRHLPLRQMVSWDVTICRAEKRRIEGATTVVTITSYRPTAAARRAAGTASARPRMERVLRALEGFAGVMADSAQAARAYESASSAAERQAVLARFSNQAGRHDLGVTRS
jgi:hypothetical protein